MKHELTEGAHVEIYLTNGAMVRGIITTVRKEVVVVGSKPAIHSPYGVTLHDKIWIDPEHISIVGYIFQERKIGDRIS